ncbi:MAG TPA: hypothetical protein VGK74_08025 [Symbiobacteriaceae bacterium]
MGKSQEAVWGPRFEAVRRALPRVGIQAVLLGQAPVSVVDVAPADILAVHNLAAVQGLHALLLPNEDGVPWEGWPSAARRRWRLTGGPWRPGTEGHWRISPGCRRAAGRRRRW